MVLWESKIVGFNSRHFKFKMITIAKYIYPKQSQNGSYNQSQISRTSKHFIFTFFVFVSLPLLSNFLYPPPSPLPSYQSSYSVIVCGLKVPYPQIDVAIQQQKIYQIFFSIFFKILLVRIEAAISIFPKNIMSRCYVSHYYLNNMSYSRK